MMILTKENNKEVFFRVNWYHVFLIIPHTIHTKPPIIKIFLQSVDVEGILSPFECLGHLINSEHVSNSSPNKTIYSRAVSEASFTEDFARSVSQPESECLAN